MSVQAYTECVGPGEALRATEGTLKRRSSEDQLSKCQPAREGAENRA